MVRPSGRQTSRVRGDAHICQFKWNARTQVSRSIQHCPSRPRGRPCRQSKVLTWPYRMSAASSFGHAQPVYESSAKVCWCRCGFASFHRRMPGSSHKKSTTIKHESLCASCRHASDSRRQSFGPPPGHAMCEHHTDYRVQPTRPFSMRAMCVYVVRLLKALHTACNVWLLDEICAC